MHLDPPKNIEVTNEVINGVLIANVKWDNGDVSINGKTLEMNWDVFTDIHVTQTLDNQYIRRSLNESR